MPQGPATGSAQQLPELPDQPNLALRRDAQHTPVIDPITEERALRRSCHRTLGFAHPQLQRRVHVPRDTAKHTLARPLAPDMDHHIVGVTNEPVPAPFQLAVQTRQQNVRQQRIWEPYGYGNLSPCGR